MRFVYSIIKFVPDPARGEYVNFGAIAGSDVTGEWDLRTVRDKRRARYIDDADVFKRVAAVVEDLGATIDRAMRAGEPLLADVGPSEGWLLRLAIESNNLLQFTLPTPIVADTIDEVFEFAFRELIVDPTTNRRP